jgi:hypothetical protein
MRLLVSSLINGLLFNARETVEVDTPANRAISAICKRFCSDAETEFDGTATAETGDLLIDLMLEIRRRQKYHRIALHRYEKQTV